LLAVGPNALKIDRRIVAPIAEDPRARTMVRAIIEIAETLDIRTIAEGVEEAEHVAILRDLGCDYAQGFHYARALAEDELAHFVRHLAPYEGESCQSA